LSTRKDAVKITEEFKKQISLYINLLNKTLPENTNTLEFHELNHWIPNCIECLQFALDNEELLKDKPSLFNDAVETIHLLYAWITNQSSGDYAYIILRKKFGKIYSPKEVGTALKKLVGRLKETGSAVVEHPEHIEYQGKSLKNALDELSQQWNNTVNNNFQNISSIKKQIKHSRNPLEIKMLNKKLNELYKNK